MSRNQSSMTMRQRKAQIEVRFAPGGNAQAGADSRTIRFTFATSDVCRDGDRILPGAWDLENFKRNPIFGFNHDMSKPPIGKVVEIAERDGKLVGSVRFGDGAFADSIYRMYLSAR
jgi:hypothetical protein